MAWSFKAAAGGIVAAALLAGGAQAQGVFTAEQAANGKMQFDSNCASCHGANLEGGDGPSLSGIDFLGNWGTAGGIYGYYSVSMPPTAPGQLGDAVYTDILAYILSFNGLPAGDTPLPTDPAALDGIDLVALASTAAPAADPAAEPADAAPVTSVPQAFTFGKPLPGYDAPAAAAAADPAAAPTSTVPQAFTFGKQLPNYTPPDPAAGSAGANP